MFNKYTVLSWRGICIIDENEHVKVKRFKGLKKALLEEKYPTSLIEASILKVKEISFEVLKQKYKKWGNYSFHYYAQSQQSKRFSYVKTKLW